MALSILTAVFVGITVVLGVLTTGSGPHAGDNSDAKALAPRNGLNPALLQQIHSYPAYITFGLTLALVLAVYIVGAVTGRRARCAACGSMRCGLLGIEFVQIIVGITQAKEGLPIGLVNIHLVLGGHPGRRR